MNSVAVETCRQEAEGTALRDAGERAAALRAELAAARAESAEERVRKISAERFE